jgi:periodic tryptophan protein 2
MKFNYQFSNLCGAVYKRGNILFSNDGTALLSPVGNRITLFDLVNQKSVTYPVSTNYDISTLALSPDNSILVAVDIQGRAIFINYHKRVLLTEMHFQSPVIDLKFSHGGEYLAVTHDTHIQIWAIPRYLISWKPLSLINTFTGHFKAVTTLAWSKDDAYLATGGKDHQVKIYKIMAKKEENYQPFTLAAHKSAIIAVYWGIRTDLHTKRSLYTVSKDGSLFLWSFHTPEQTAEREQRPIEQVLDDASEPNADTKSHQAKPKRELQALGKHSGVGKWHLVNKHYFNENHAKVVSAALYQSQQNNLDLLVIGFDSGLFALYEMPGFNCIHTLSISQAAIQTIAINSTGAWIAFGSEKLGQLLVWEWKSEGYILRQQGHYSQVNTLCYTADGQTIITGGEDGKVKLWNTSTGFCFITFPQHTAPITGVSYCASNNIVLSSSADGTVRAFDLLRYKNFRTFTSPQPTQFTSCAVDATGEIVIAAAHDPFEIYIWSVQTGKLLDVLTGHEGPISCLALSSSLSLLASSSWDKTVRIWDIFNNKGCIETFSHSSDVLCCAFRGDGAELCCATLDGQLYFWDVQAGTVKFQLECKRDIQFGRRANDARAANNSTHNLHFTSLVYSADGSHVLAGGNSKYLCIYNIQARLLVKKFSISENRSLDGVVDQLNSRFIQNGHDTAQLDDISSEDEDRIDRSLPGAQRGEFSKRKNTKLAVATRCVQFSATNLQFSAATTEGLIVFSLDENLIFDPTELTEGITPTTIRATLRAGEFSKALVMALALNELDLIELCVKNTPVEEIQLVIQSIPLHRLHKLFDTIIAQLEASQSIEYYLYWSECLLTQKAQFFKQNNQKIVTSFRALQRALSKQTKEVSKICNENQYLLELLTIEANQPQKLTIKRDPAKVEESKKQENAVEVSNGKKIKPKIDFSSPFDEASEGEGEREEDKHNINSLAKNKVAKVKSEAIVEVMQEEEESKEETSIKLDQKKKKSNKHELSTAKIEAEASTDEEAVNQVKPSKKKHKSSAAQETKKSKSHKKTKQ